MPLGCLPMSFCAQNRDTLCSPEHHPKRYPMRSSAARLILGAGALLALGASAFLVRQFEQQITALRSAQRAFEMSAHDAAADVSTSGFPRRRMSGRTGRGLLDAEGREHGRRD